MTRYRRFHTNKKIQSGDTDAFEIIVRKYYQSIYLFCCRRLNGDPDTAVDITQDVFLKLLEKIQSVRKIGKFQNYLLTIAVNTCNNYTKKAKPLYMDLETLEDIEDTDNAFEKLSLTNLKRKFNMQSTHYRTIKKRSSFYDFIMI